MAAEAVVITGAAAVGPHGATLADLRAALEGGETLARAADPGEFGVAGGSRLAALVPELDWTRWIPPAALRRMSHSSRLFVAAGRDAVADAGLAVDLVEGTPRPLPDARVALSLNLAFGGTNTALVFRSADGGDGR